MKRIPLILILSNSVVRQEVTLDSIDETLEIACESNKTTQKCLESFIEQVNEDHPRQDEKLDQIIEAVKK